jgi:hypothetical protein
MTAREWMANRFFDLVTALVKSRPGPVDQNGVAIFGPKRVYVDGDVPDDAVPGYILYGAAPELPVDYLSGQVGVDGEYTFHPWATTKPNAARLAQWLSDTLTEVPLTLAGQDLDISIRLGGERSDPSRRAFQKPVIVTVNTTQHA